jgi:hypothetical protein
MARRRKRTRKTEVRENGPELLWILAGLGVLGAGTVVYLATRPPATTTVQAATQARLNAIESNIADLANEGIPAPVSDTIPNNVATALSNGGGSTGPVNTGNSDVDNAANSAINNATGQATDAVNNATSSAGNAVNSAASQLGF